jgi:hypothetical protein
MKSIVDSLVEKLDLIEAEDKMSDEKKAEGAEIDRLYDDAERAVAAYKEAEDRANQALGVSPGSHIWSPTPELKALEAKRNDAYDRLEDEQRAFLHKYGKWYGNQYR